MFTNACGGTGASTIATNVAYQSFKRNLRVLVIDLNILYPTMNMVFGVPVQRERPDLVSYLLGKDELANCIYNTPVGVSVMFANNRGLIDYINLESDTAIDNF